MSQFRRSRRWFIRTFAALVAFVPAYRTLWTRVSAESNAAAAEGAAVNIDRPAPGNQTPAFGEADFAKGTITKVSAVEIDVDLLVGDAARFVVTPSSRVWRGDWGATSGLAEGDVVSIIAPLVNGRREVVKMWANIVNLLGTMRSPTTTVGGTRVQHESAQGVNTVFVTPETSLMLPSGETKYGASGTASVLDDGRGAQIIGLRLPDGTVRATRIWPFS